MVEISERKSEIFLKCAGDESVMECTALYGTVNTRIPIPKVPNRFLTSADVDNRRRTISESASFVPPAVDVFSFEAQRSLRPSLELVDCVLGSSFPRNSCSTSLTSRVVQLTIPAMLRVLQTIGAQGVDSSYLSLVISWQKPLPA